MNITARRTLLTGAAALLASPALAQSLAQFPDRPIRIISGFPPGGLNDIVARAVAQAADMKKAEHIVILDVRGISMVTDFIVIASGTSMPHLRAIRNEIAERIHEERREKPHSSQGMAESQWMLLDYGDVVAHIFLNEKRELYALEDLWSDAPRLDWTPL